MSCRKDETFPGSCEPTLLASEERPHWLDSLVAVLDDHPAYDLTVRTVEDEAAGRRAADEDVAGGCRDVEAVVTNNARQGRVFDGVGSSDQRPVTSIHNARPDQMANAERVAATALVHAVCTAQALACD